MRKRLTMTAKLRILNCLNIFAFPFLDLITRPAVLGRGRREARETHASVFRHLNTAGLFYCGEVL
jgi:hypothetical protein